MLTALLTLVAVAAPTAPEVVAPWFYEQATDAMTDKRTSSAWVWTADGKSRLSFRCDSAMGQVVSLQYLTPEFLGSSPATVQVRVNHEPVIEHSWLHRDKVAFLSTDDAAPTIKEYARALSRAKTVFVRAFTFESRSVEAIFPAENAAAAIQRVFMDCEKKSPL